jgi:signal transduction histidine kinase
MLSNLSALLVVFLVVCFLEAKAETAYIYSSDPEEFINHFESKFSDINQRLDSLKITLFDIYHYNSIFHPSIFVKLTSDYFLRLINKTKRFELMGDYYYWYSNYYDMINNADSVSLMMVESYNHYKKYKNYTGMTHSLNTLGSLGLSMNFNNARIMSPYYLEGYEASLKSNDYFAKASGAWSKLEYHVRITGNNDSISKYLKLTDQYITKIPKERFTLISWAKKMRMLMITSWYNKTDKSELDKEERLEIIQNKKEDIFKSLINFHNMDYFEIAVYYHEMKMYDSAYKYIILSKNSSNDDYSDILVKLRVFKLLYKIEKETGKFALATQAIDSLLYYTDIKSDFDPRIRSIDLINKLQKEKLQDKIEAEKNQKFITVILAIVIILATFIVLYVIFARYKTVRLLNSKLDDANKTKDKFFSIISHDLKTPLSGIMSLSNLVSNNYDDFSDTEKRKHLRVLEKSTENLLGLLNNLLIWSQLQTGRIKYFHENINMSEIINVEINLLKGFAGNKSIALESNLATQIQVFADRNMIATVVRNLISNSIKYSNPNSFIRIYQTEAKDGITIAIEDGGIGISEEDKSKIFRIESKMSKLGTSGENGTGLGLTLCKEFIDKNNGKIWFESELEKGTTFFITLPKAEIR